MTAQPEPVTPAQAAALLDAAVKGSGAIVCYSRCWACMFGQHRNPPRPHPWWDSEDAEHAEATGQPAPTGNCACPCARTAEEPTP